MRYTFESCATKYNVAICQLNSGILVTYFNEGLAGTSIYLVPNGSHSCIYIAEKMGLSLQDAVNIMAFVCQKFPGSGLVDEFDLQHWMHARYSDPNRAIA